MVDGTDVGAAHQETVRENAVGSRRKAWAAYAACGWAFLFAAPSFYWAAGGTVGIGTLDPGITAMSRDPWFVALVWATGVAKVLAGLLALALVRTWGQRIPRWILLAGAWGGTRCSSSTAATSSSRARLPWAVTSTYRHPRLGRRSAGTPSFGDRTSCSAAYSSAPRPGATSRARGAQA